MKKFKKIFTSIFIMLVLGIILIPSFSTKAFESTEVFVIDSSDFDISINELHSESGGTAGLIQFKATYDYYNNHDSTPITIAGFNLVSIVDDFKYQTGVGDYVTLGVNNFANYSITIISESFITAVETVTPILDPIFNGRDIVLENNAIETARITIYLNFTLDPLYSPPYNVTYQNHIIDNNFNFKIYESDYNLGYRAGYDYGLTMDVQNARAEGYYEGKAEFGYFDPITRTWLGYEDGYIIGFNEGSFDGYNNGISDALKTYPYDIYLNGFRSTYRNPIDNSILVDSNSYLYLEGYNDGVILTENQAYDLGYLDGGNDAFTANLHKWIVPAIIIVLVVGGFIGFSKMRKSG